jgi:hypothetical protein
MESYWEGYSNMKPTVKLENWYVASDVIWNPYRAPELRKYVLFGEAYHHPKFEDGDKIYSSPIIDIEGRVITTQNTIYILASADAAYTLWCKENNILIDLENPLKTIKDNL